MKRLIKIIIWSSSIALVLLLAILSYFFIDKTPISNNSTWGVDFSQSQAEYLGLNWEDAYLAIIKDLGAKNIKLHTNWNWVEGSPPTNFEPTLTQGESNSTSNSNLVGGKQDNYFFNDIDWQIKQAEDNNVKIIYVIGMKTGRWPECHMPDWTNGLSEKNQQDGLLSYITQVVQRYKGSKAIAYWQVENEPLFKFGECPSWYYNNENFLKKEVALVKSLDPKRQIIISDSGEQSTWFDVAKIGDIVGITMYRNVWTHITDTFGFYLTYTFLDPLSYMRKAQVIKKVFGKDVICIELQAEPWTSEPLMQAPLSEQLKSMNPQMFNDDVAFAKKTGLNKFYFWGAEWWYWMKEKQNQPEIWNEAKKLFQPS